MDGAESKLTSMLRETPRDSVLLPQEHKRQTERRCLAVQNRMQKIHRNIQYTNEHHTWVIT